MTNSEPKELEDDSNHENLTSNTLELGKIILAISSAGVGLLKLKNQSIDCLEQISASFFMMTIIVLVLAYWAGSYSATNSYFECFKDSVKRDKIINWLNTICNFCFLIVLFFLTISIWV